MTTIADQLIDARKRRGLTLKQVSDATGLTVGFLSDIEHGRGNATIKTLETLAAFYALEWRLVPQDTDVEHIRKRLFADALTAYQAGDSDSALVRLLELVGDVIGFKIEESGVTE